MPEVRVSDRCGRAHEGQRLAEPQAEPLTGALASRDLGEGANQTRAVPSGTSDRLVSLGLLVLDLLRPSLE